MIARLYSTLQQNYRIPHEIIILILSNVEFEELAALGCPDSILDEVGIKSPPRQILEPISLNISATLLKQSLMQQTPPSEFWFLCHRSTFSWYLRHYRSQLCGVLLTRAPEIFDRFMPWPTPYYLDFLAAFNRIDLINCLERDLEFAQRLNTGKHHLLSAAASIGHLTIVRHLVMKGSIYKCPHALDRAAVENKLAIVKFLTEHCPNIQCEPETFDTVCERGLLEMAEYLTKQRPDAICSTVAMDQAASQGHFDMVKFLFFERNEGCSTHAIDAAADIGRIDIVKFLVEQGKQGSSNAIDGAAGSGHFKVVEYLIKVCLILMQAKFPHTEYAIDMASHMGHYEIVKLLHKHGARCTQYALNNAAMFGHLNIVQFLHTNRTEGCDTNAINGAALHGHYEIVKFLLQNRTEGFNVKAIDDCFQLGNERMAELLLANQHLLKL